jgi:hypothetical protein
MKNLSYTVIFFLLFSSIASGKEGMSQTILVKRSIALTDVPERVLANFPDQIALFLDIYFSDKFPEIHRTHYFNQEKDFAVIQTNILNFFVRKPEDKEYLDAEEDDPRHGGKRIVVSVSVLDGKTGKVLLENFSINYHDHVAGREEDSALLMDDTVCVIAKQVAQIIATTPWNQGGSGAAK